jgi:hypothetical protein
LEDIEETPADKMPYSSIKNLSGYDATTIYGHIELLIESGFVDGKIIRIHAGIVGGVMITKITWKGHDFLDAARNDKLWSKAQKVFLKPGVAFTVDILLEWLKTQAKSSLGLP